MKWRKTLHEIPGEPDKDRVNGVTAYRGFRLTVLNRRCESGFWGMIDDAVYEVMKQTPVY